MTFTSLTFILFLVIVFALYWGFPHRRWQNLLVVVSSYGFYGWWDWRFCSLMLLSSVVDYGIGRALEATSLPARRRWLIAVSLAFNLGMLGFFKYFNFFTENLVSLLHLCGWQVDPFGIQVILPVGISFYTFQTLSYTIDVYRRELKATHSLVDFLAFVSFFPQLVAGPIERATNLLPQFERDRRFNHDDAVDGLRQILWGFFKKLAIADRLAPFVNEVFSNPGAYGGPELALGTVCFAFQIYCDFSAYSDIAVGTAKQFDIHLMRNFAYPYFASSITDFWRRWHISLSTWLRDYLYFPLGGNRGTPRQWAAALIVTFLISGLWHGAAWHFVVWGLFHGVAVMASRKRKATPDAEAGRDGWSSRIRSGLAVTLTFALVCVGWCLFRAQSLSDAGLMIGRIATEIWSPERWMQMLAHVAEQNALEKTLFLVALLVGIEGVMRRYQHPLQVGRLPRAIRWATYTLLLWATLDLMPQAPPAEFIYFQF